jgi:AcrR family transcriptional regulator
MAKYTSYYENLLRIWDMRKRNSPNIRFPVALSTVDAKLLPYVLGSFLTEGFGTRSFSELADNSGLTRQRVAYHYESLDEVLTRLVQLWAESGRQVTIEFLAREILASPQEKIRGMAQALFEWTRDYPDLSQLTPIISQTSRTIPAVREIYQTTLVQGETRVATFVAEIPSLEKSKPEQIADLAQACHFTLIGIGHYALSLDWRSTRLNAERTCLMVLDSFLEQITEHGVATLNQGAHPLRRKRS